MELRVFQRGFNFSQDGPGNRLVFHLQGCNLRCPWCSNPEGLTMEGGWVATPEELAEEAIRSRLMFFEGGGVTLTGGEVTLQWQPVLRLLELLKSAGIHTCIETNGTSVHLPELFPVLDLLIMDLKHHDSARHKEVTGIGLEHTVANLSAALEAGQTLALRIPLIGGFNATAKDAERFAALLTRLGAQEHCTVELLLYHEYGRSKYEKLHLPYTMGQEAHVSNETRLQMEDILRQAGLTVIRT